MSKELINKTKSSYGAIDVVKWIMSIAVICIHTRPLFGVIENGVVLRLFNSFLDLAVPFFFIASFYFLIKKMYKAGCGDFSSEKSLGVLKKYILRMVRIYCIWHLIYLPICVYDFVLNSVPFWTAVLIYLREFLFFGGSYLSAFLWFILSCIYSSSMLYIVLKLRLKTLLVVMVFLFIYILSLAFSWLIYNVNANYGYINNIILFLKKVFTHGRLGLGFLYIALSLIFVKARSFNRYIYLSLFVFAFVLNIAFYNSLLNNVFMPISVYSLFGFVVSIKTFDNPSYLFLRKQSSLIYYVHNMFVFIYALFGDYATIMYFGPLGFVFVFMCAILLSLMLIVLQKKFNWKILNLIS